MDCLFDWSLVTGHLSHTAETYLWEQFWGSASSSRTPWDVLSRGEGSNQGPHSELQQPPLNEDGFVLERLPTNAVASAPALGGKHTFSYPNLIWLLPFWRPSLSLSGTYKWHLTKICDLTLLDFEQSKDTWDLNMWGKTPTDSCPRMHGMVANGGAMPSCSQCFFLMKT